jgi:hypothetical protein
VSKAVSQAAADPFFAGLPSQQSRGVECFICSRPAMQAFVDDILRGMAGEGPYAGEISPHTPLEPLRLRLADEALMRPRGLPVYPRSDSAFRTHMVEHRRELWALVKAHRREV